MTITQAAQLSGLSAHTIRYYDKEGLLPYVGRTAAGVRVFTERDLDWLSLITCLKNTGMPIRGIREYINWYQAGDDTLQQRLDMFLAQQQHIREQMAQLESYMEKINHKVEVYTRAVAEGTLVRQSNAG
ncbi:MerR family transcriptional regulator [Eubacteriales bacterium OttesenSCG-928-A19]|nr:MerR family transcriptional regulator [Eubacteriales bacterium OttesenSCG-928-A19]